MAHIWTLRRSFLGVHYDHLIIGRLWDLDGQILDGQEGQHGHTAGPPIAITKQMRCDEAMAERRSRRIEVVVYKLPVERGGRLSNTALQ